MKKGLIPIPIPKEQMIKMVEEYWRKTFKESTEYEKYKIELDHAEWTEKGITLWTKQPKRK